MRKIAFLIGLSYMLFAQFLDAQITTEEAPPIFDLYMSSLKGVNLNTSEQSLPSPDMKTIEMEDRANDGKRGGPLRFAYPVKVHYTLTNSGRWFDLKDGSKLWRLKVRLPGALSTNASYDVFRLPKGAKFYVYSEDTKQYIGAITYEYLPVYESSNIPYAFATGLIYGETVTFEYYQPATVRDNAIISICRIDYGYRFIDNPYINADIARSEVPRGYGASGECQVDVNCSEGQKWKREKDAVSRILVKSEYGTGWCSCALINNTLNDNTPYVLTANHCLEDKSGNPLFDAEKRSDLPDWVFYWGYEHPDCENKEKKRSEPIRRATIGAEVIANGDADFALLKLKQDPRNLTGFDRQLDAWCTDSLQYLFDTFGRENIVSAHLHMDEKTPHIHATLVPIVREARTRRKKEDQVKRHYRKKSADTPRLCADDIMTRGRLKSYQDGYAKAMSHHGLQRGIDGSEARHISTQQYYRDLKQQSCELQSDIDRLQADKAVADEALRQAKREVQVERLKGSAVTAATQITDSIGSLFGGGKVKALEKENEALKKQIESLESQAEQREQNIRQMEKVHRAERLQLVEYIEKVKRYFPQVEKLLPLVDFCRKTMHFSEELCRKLCELRPLKVSGALYSDEFDRKFPAENTSVAFGHEKETDEHFTLLLDGVDFVRWFRQRMDRLREDMGIPRKQSLGMRR